MSDVKLGALQAMLAASKKAAADKPADKPAGEAVCGKCGKDCTYCNDAENKVEDTAEQGVEE